MRIARLSGFGWLCMSLLSVLLASGCGMHRPDAPTAVAQLPAQAVETVQPQWWYLRFRLARDGAGEVNSFLDTLIADRVIAPVLERYRRDIMLWRFHRRWPDDATGHQFSFILYAPPAVAQQLIDTVARSDTLQTLRRDGHLIEHRVDQPAVERRADVAATSDPAWSPAIQQQWPHFIMGASRMWLGLVQSEAATQEGGDLYQAYRDVEQALDERWFTEGNHAFFHHLSGLFGYRPLRVIRRDIMTF